MIVKQSFMMKKQDYFIEIKTIFLILMPNMIQMEMEITKKLVQMVKKFFGPEVMAGQWLHLQKFYGTYQIVVKMTVKNMKQFLKRWLQH